MITLNMAGFTNQEIASITGRRPRTVSRWLLRVKSGGTISDAKRSGRPRTFSECDRLKTIAIYCQQSPPMPGVHRWSLTDAQRYFKGHPEKVNGAMSRSTIHRILLDHALRPHRQNYYLQLTDPDFFGKMEHIVSLYLNMPEYLYCFDECTCIQALKRLSPDLPPDPHQVRRQDFDYRRNGITDLLAFLNPRTGEVYGKCTDNHNRHTLCQVFRAHVETHHSDAVIHYIMDNLTCHYHDDFCQTVAKLSNVSYAPLENGAERRKWLQSEDKRIVVHFIPFHASWLNMVEIWFGILKGKCLSYGHFQSVKHLRESIVDFIETWNLYFAHPFNWSYTGAGLHQSAVRRFCRLLLIETDQMDSKFLRSQLALMNNIAENYLRLISTNDWQRFLSLAVDKKNYMLNIIENESGPKRQKQARDIYDQFCQTVLNDDELLAIAG